MSARPEAERTAEEWLVLTIAHILNGNAVEAEKAAVAALALKLPQPAPESALAADAMEHSKLKVAVSRVKPILSFRADKASFHNLLGISRWMNGEYGKAQEAFDLAAAFDSNWGVPWINGALNLYSKGDVAQAKKAATEGMRLGDKSARAYVVLAEIELAGMHNKLAWERIDQATFRDPYDPYLHLVRANAETAEGRNRRAERSIWQGIETGMTGTTLPTLSYHQAKDWHIALGTDERHLAARSTAGRGLSFTLEAGSWDKEEGVEVDASRVSARITHETSWSTASLAYDALAGDRTVWPFLSTSLNPNPNARLTGELAMAGWQGRLGRTTLGASVRHAKVDFDTSVVTFTEPRLSERQIIGEIGYSTGPFDFGGIYSLVSRNGGRNVALEPLEQSFPDGRTETMVAYGLFRKQIRPDMYVTAGGSLTRVGDETTAQLAGELRLRLIGNRFLVIGARPSIGASHTNLYPDYLLPWGFGTNDVDRTYHGSLNWNRSPYLHRSDGRSLDYTMSLPLLDAGGTSVVIELFHRRASGVEVVGGDPRFVALNKVGIPDGESSGMRVRSTVQLGDNMDLQLSATAQKTHANFTQRTFEMGNSVGGLKEIREDRLPNVPPVEATASLAFSGGPVDAGVQTAFVGARPKMANQGPFILVGEAESAFALNVFATCRLRGGSYLRVAGLNLTGTSYYGGFPGRATYLIECGGRF